MRFNVAQGRAMRQRPKVAVASFGCSLFYAGRTPAAADARGRLVMATLIPTDDAYSNRPYIAESLVGQDSTTTLQALANVSARDYRIVADPHRWRDIATDCLADYNSGLTTAIRSIRAS